MWAAIANRAESKTQERARTKAKTNAGGESNKGAHIRLADEPREEDRSAERGADNVTTSMTQDAPREASYDGFKRRFVC